MPEEETLEERSNDFVFAVFGELNDHIRATDEKNVVIGGTFVALMAVAMALVIDRITVFAWEALWLSAFLLLIGTIVYLLQRWYRSWKKHYLMILANIASQFTVDDKLMPFWLRGYENRRFSADELLLFMTYLINLGLIGYVLYQLFGLVDFLPIGDVLIIITLIGGYIATVSIARRLLVNRAGGLLA